MIAIVGAGLSGLALAHELAARALPYVVLEESAVAGGVIRSARIDGHLLEWGPQRTRLTPTIRALVDDLGLAREMIVAPADLPLLIYRGNALHAVPRSLAEFARTDLIRMRGRFRLLAEPLTAGGVPEESVAHYFTRKVGRELYENLIGPLYGGLYASDPADMLVGLSLTHALRDLGIGRSLLARAVRGGGTLRVPAAVSFRHGMQTLTDALYARHREHVRLAARVERIAGTAGGFILHTSDGDVHADHIVITSSARRTSALIAGITPDAAAAAATLHYNPLAIVHLHTAAPVQRGIGFQVSFEEHELHTRGVTFNDALFDRAGVYTSYLGGAQHAEVAAWNDTRTADTAVREFAHIARIDPSSVSVISVARAAMPAWDRSWTALSRIRPPAGINFCTNWDARPGIPGRLAQARRIAESLAAIARGDAPMPTQPPRSGRT